MNVSFILKTTACDRKSAISKGPCGQLHVNFLCSDMIVVDMGISSVC